MVSLTALHIKIISTHTLTWSVTQLSVSSQRQAYFNSHAHVERDVQGATVGKTSSNFNSHAHVERDENVVDMGKQILDFNSHAHVERDEVQMSFTEMQVKFQLTRSRGA